MALMSLKLWQLIDLALPMIVILLVQTVLMFLYANFVVFNVMGRDYEAAAMTTAFCGFGMGATPNAMANMKALAERYGAAPRAFFVVPLVGICLSISSTESYLRHLSTSYRKFPHTRGRLSAGYFLCYTFTTNVRKRRDR